MKSSAIYRNTLIVIPAFNEMDSIGKVVKSVRSAGFSEIVVVDDSSSDSTATIAEAEGAIVIPLLERIGAWGATQTGFRFALRKGYKWVVTLDADEQHRASDIEPVLNTMIRGHHNVLVAADISRGSGARHLAWKLVRVISGLKLRDITSGFRAYDRLAVRCMASWRATLLSYQDVGVLMLLTKYGLKVSEKSVSMSPRVNGKSRIFSSWGAVLFYMLHTCMLSASKRPIISRAPSRGK